MKHWVVTCRWGNVEARLSGNNGVLCYILDLGGKSGKDGLKVNDKYSLET
jgi:hypothetical protein